MYQAKYLDCHKEPQIGISLCSLGEDFIYYYDLGVNTANIGIYVAAVIYKHSVIVGLKWDFR